MRVAHIGLTLAMLWLTLALMAAPSAHAYGFINDGLQVEIIDRRGRAFPTYPTRDGRRDAERRAYLAARAGAVYAIRVTNRRPERVGLVIAVDGRNILSGKRSRLSHREKMYVLEPWQTATYRGWRTGRSRINEFYFTDERDAYAGAFGDYTAMGVLAIAAFEDRHARRYRFDPEPQAHGNDGYRRKAPSTGDSSAKHRGTYESAPGTGFGDERYSPTYGVRFEARRGALSRTLIKYEWPQTLCDMGVSHCRHARNRLWHDSGRWSHADRGYAPYPPGYRAPGRYRYVPRARDRDDDD